MRNWLRRIRGAVGIAATWAATWSFAGAAMRWIFGVDTDAPLSLVFGVFGFIGGLIFSGVLALAEGRRRFDQMSLPRFAAWGAVGGLLLTAVVSKVASLGWADVLALAPTLAVASAVCASGSLALASRAEKRALTDGREDPAEPDIARDDERTLPSGDD